MQASNQLESLIQELKLKLALYAQKDNANEIYIHKQNQLILNLVEVYNEIPVLQYVDVWKQIETEIEDVLNRDSELSGVCIRLKFNDKSNNYALINY